ncbi:ficolin-2-like [Anopheles nili]|uniref:ficolin-2-like n=1 Tax=Anopheles nili TaxID=185578 RepID=UPI00237B63F1|nr:ficolin-2-like [Anopheles nili]
MILKLGFCMLLALASVLGNESCFKRGETFLSKLNTEIEFLEKSIVGLSSIMKDVMWSSLQMEMRLRLLRMEMDTFRQASLVADSATSMYNTPSASIKDSSSSTVLPQKPAPVASSPASTTTTSSNISCLQQLLQDQVQGNVLIEIKVAPTTTVVQPTEPAPKTGEITSCSKAPKTGIYQLKLSQNVSTNVLCDADYDNGGWVVIQYRFNGSEEFYRNWTDYNNGFGSLNGEFWLGNQYIYQLTTEKPREIVFMMEDFEGGKAVAKYASFKMGDQTEKYILKSLGSFSGNAGDSLSRNVGSKFSTPDMDNDKSSSHCALLYAGGWWYDDCHLSNLNGQYMKGPTSVYAKSMCWSSFKGFHYSLKISRIMVRF